MASFKGKNLKSLKAKNSNTVNSSLLLGMTMVAYNYIPPVNVASCTVKRKGKVIKGETEANIIAARIERRAVVNAAKRLRRERRAA